MLVVQTSVAEAHACRYYIITQVRYLSVDVIFIHCHLSQMSIVYIISRVSYKGIVHVICMSNEGNETQLS